MFAFLVAHRLNYNILNEKKKKSNKPGGGNVLICNKKCTKNRINLERFLTSLKWWHSGLCMVMSPSSGSRAPAVINQGPLCRPRSRTFLHTEPFPSTQRQITADLLSSGEAFQIPMCPTVRAQHSWGSPGESIQCWWIEFP